MNVRKGTLAHLALRRVIGRETEVAKTCASTARERCLRLILLTGCWYILSRSKGVWPAAEIHQYSLGLLLVYILYDS